MSGPQRVAHAVGRRRRDRARATRRAAVSWRTPVGVAVGVAPDHAARRVAAVVARRPPPRAPAGSRAARGGRAPTARPAVPARRASRSAAVGHRPSASAIPAAALDPACPRPATAVGGRADARDQRVDRVAALELDLAAARAPRRPGAGARRSAPGARPRPGASASRRVPGPASRLDVADGARGDDPPVANARSPRPSAGPSSTRPASRSGRPRRGRHARSSRASGGGFAAAAGAPSAGGRVAASSAACAARSAPPRGVLARLASDGRDRHRVERLRGRRRPWPCAAAPSGWSGPRRTIDSTPAARGCDADDDQHRGGADEVATPARR